MSQLRCLLILGSLRNIVSVFRNFTRPIIALLTSFFNRLSALVKFISEFIVYLSIVLFSFYIITMSVLSPKITVFVDQFSLPEDVIKNGYSQKIFTEQVVTNAKLIAIKMADKNYLKIIENKYYMDNKEKEVTNCYINSFSLKEITKNITDNLSKDASNNLKKIIDTDWGNTDITIPEYGISIRDFVSKLFSRKVLIGGHIVKENDSYIIQISSKFSDTGSVYSIEYKAKNITDAKIKSAEYILKYAHPVIFAIRNTDNPKDAEDAINIAKINNYTDNDKFISLLDTLIGFITLHDQSITSKAYVSVKSRDYFEEALAKDKSNTLAMIGNAIANLYIFESHEGSLFPETKETARNNTISKAESILSSISQTDSRMLAYAYAILANLNEALGRKDKAEGAWQNTLKNMEKLAEKNTSNEDLLNILFDYALFSIRQKNYKLADLLLETMYMYKINGDKNENKLIQSITNKIDYRYNLGKAILISETGNIEETEHYTQLLKIGGNPCALSHWANHLYTKAGEEKDSNTASYLYNDSNVFFTYAERNGMRGFNFYNNWANLLGDQLGRLEQAIEKYHKALNYNGPHSWVFLNLGNNFSRIGRYKEAENKFRESLEDGITTAGVRGYLNSIYYQKDYQRFLEEYHKYDIHVESDYIIELFVGFSYCMLNDHVMADKFLLKIQNINAISNDDRESLRSCINNIKLNKPHQSQGGH